MAQTGTTGYRWSQLGTTFTSELPYLCKGSASSFQLDNTTYIAQEIHRMTKNRSQLRD